MNKILIALVLVVVISGNAYADSPLETNTCSEIISEIKKVDNLIKQYRVLKNAYPVGTPEDSVEKFTESYEELNKININNKKKYEDYDC